MRGRGLAAADPLLVRRDQLIVTVRVGVVYVLHGKSELALLLVALLEPRERKHRHCDSGAAVARLKL